MRTQRRRGDLDRRERRSQIVRDGAHESATEPIHLFQQLRTKCLLTKLGSLQREGRVVGKRVKYRPVGVGNGQTTHRENAHRATRRRKRYRSQLLGICLYGTDADWLTGLRIELTELFVRQLLAGEGSNLQTVILQDQQRDARDAKDRVGRLHNGPQEIIDGPVPHQELRQVVQPSRGLVGAAGFGSRRVQTGYDASDHQHHDDVDNECRPVLGRTDVQRAVRRHVLEVIDEQSRGDTHDPCVEAPTRRTDHYRDDEDEPRGRHTDVRTKRQEGRPERYDTHDPDNGTHESSLHSFSILRKPNEFRWLGELRNYDEGPPLFKIPLRSATAESVHGRFLHISGHHRVRPFDAWSHLGIGPRMTFTQIILLGVAVVMFLYLGYAMCKPEKF